MEVEKTIYSQQSCDDPEMDIFFVNAVEYAFWDTGMHLHRACIDFICMLSIIVFLNVDNWKPIISSLDETTSKGTSLRHVYTYRS
jgi:hypothetical protein